MRSAISGDSKWSLLDNDAPEHGRAMVVVGDAVVRFAVGLGLGSVEIQRELMIVAPA